MTVLSPGLSAAILVTLIAGPSARQAATPPAGPEAFDVKVTMVAPPPAVGTVVVPVTIQIDRYTPEHARVTMTDALKHGGYPGFLRALRDAPPAGNLDINGRKIRIRWARQVATESGRTLSFVTEAPVYFVGGALKNAKPTAGYELGVILFTLDKKGSGEGTMAAAARVKPGGDTGVRLDDYAETPLKLTAAARPPQ